MKGYVRGLLLACVLPFVFGGCATTEFHETAWEYKVVEIVPSPSIGYGDKQLNEMARQGWILVSESSYFTGNETREVFVFKRALPR